MQGRGARRQARRARQDIDKTFRKLLQDIRKSSTKFDAQGTVLRLKNYMNSQASPEVSVKGRP